VALEDFIKKNAAASTKGKIGKGIIAFDVANLITAEDKLKALLRLFRDLILMKPVLQTAFAGLFLGMGKSIRALVHDTGSLETALKKLMQIQGLQRMFAPLVGGAAAAKLKVAELVNFAASKNLKLGDVGEAERSLMLMTRGSFSGAAALSTVNDAAQATGNSFTDMADAVGEFSDTLLSGGSIAAATEQLRQMGVVTEADARSMVQLQENSASAGQVFGALTNSLERFSGGAKSAAEDIDNINAAYEAAAANLQNKFASPFVESEVENTKNMTEAMNAVAPSVARVSGYLAILSNGFGTAKTWAAKTAAESKILRGILEGLVYVITGLITVVSAVAAVGLAVWLISAASAATGLAAAVIALTGATGGFATALTALGVALKVAMLASGIGVLVVLAATVAGVALQLGASADRAAKALQDLARAQNEANAALETQIRNVRTLTERNEVLAKTLDAVTTAQLALNEAQKTFNKEKIENAEAALAIAEKTARRAARIPTSGLAPVEERLQAERDRVKREQVQKQERFQSEFAASTPERQARLLGAHAADAEAKARRAAIGERERIKVTEQMVNADLRVLDRQKRVEIARAQLTTAQTVAKGPWGQNDVASRDARMAAQKAAADLKLAEQALAEAKTRQAGVGLNAARGTSVQLEAAQRAMAAGTDPDRARKAAALGLAAERARNEEAMRGENELIALRDREAAKAIERETRLNKLAIEQELKIQALQIKGDNLGLQRLDDLSVFAEKYQELLAAGIDEKTAKDLASKFAKNAITLDAKGGMAAAQSTIADSLTRIGGGGGVYAPSGDPLLTAAQRQIQLHEDELIYLKEIAGAGKKGGVL